MEEMKPVLSIKNLTKHLSSKLILNNISLDVMPGEIFGFLGPNGSGKTTTIKVVLGLLSLEAGEVSVCGYDMRKAPMKAMNCVNGIIENPEMYKYLTGRQNLMQYLRMYDGIPESRCDEVAEIVGLSARLNDKVGKYSLGMRQRLGLAQAMLNRPKLLILDEPTNGLDPVGIKELRDILKRLSHIEGTAVFISSHQLAELDLMCDRVGIIDRGNLVAVKTMEEIRQLNGGSVSEYLIGAEEPDRALELIIAAGNAAVIDGNLIRVTADTAKGGKALPEMLRELILADVRVTSAEPVRHSLEDAFLEITGSYSPDKRKAVGI